MFLKIETKFYSKWWKISIEFCEIANCKFWCNSPTKLYLCIWPYFIWWLIFTTWRKEDHLTTMVSPGDSLNLFLFNGSLLGCLVSHLYVLFSSQPVSLTPPVPRLSDIVILSSSLPPFHQPHEILHLSQDFHVNFAVNVHCINCAFLDILNH